MKQNTPILIDIDGVLRLGGKPAPGLHEFFDFLNKEKLNACLVSNTTLTTSVDQKKFFDEQKIELNIPILTASDATYNYVKENYKKAAVYCIDKVKKIFEDIIDMDNPDVVVIGDMEKEWNYEILTEIFRKVRAGADLVAMQKNRFWNTPEEGYLLDVGPFVAAIEYATEKEATIVGKPAKIYFDSALKLIGSTIKKPFVMIGDDVETDIGAAQNYGGTGILMFTGKTEKPLSDDIEIKPDYEVESLEEVIDLLKDRIFNSP